MPFLIKNQSSIAIGCQRVSKSVCVSPLSPEKLKFLEKIPPWGAELQMVLG